MRAGQSRPIPCGESAIAKPWLLVFLEDLRNNVLYYEQIKPILINI